MSDAYGGGLGRERDSRGASAARRLAAEIVPKWSGASAANTMEYETALRAIMVEGHGPVEGLLAAVYFGDVDETKEGYLKYQLLRLGAGSDEEGPLEAASDDDWGADPVAAFEAREHNKQRPFAGLCRVAPHAPLAPRWAHAARRGPTRTPDNCGEARMARAALRTHRVSLV